ncbi:hypothetical protein DYBT9623_04491 [Dyadobacter sp. CECT 9623]|uniref:Teneurin-like YD-shell domain-containing protein n=1 Tax=Dyadobacter linearis TaxID=2823330 RepID=A0ABM8UW27_9BACT|nr:FG-GAP-like repeat-containing protein [Dyadobacter sp. CECT 9623]CAG5072957.1 hypothetical protein DYBT9623_04491 [Dyadobacter sp. CECT 9623]
MRKHFTFVILLVVLASHNIIAQKKFPVKELGLSQGKIKVSESGSLTYLVPIQVVPGSSGTQPSLNIAYNHQSGNGMMGIGWNIQGLSTISRIPRSKTLYEDSYRNSLAKALLFDKNDRFSLDGQNLVLSEENISTDPSDFFEVNYGEPNTTYFPEKNDFSKVVIKDTLNGAPTYFEVKTKSGLVMEFGNTIDSRIEAPGGKIPIHWLINKISDTKGNYITFKYAENNETGEYYPLTIEYTGNDKAGIAPYASVNFNYQTSPKVSIVYSYGSQINLSKLLVSIDCKFENQIVRSYSFKYDQGDWTSKNYLKSISESVDKDTLEPIRFSWNTPVNPNSTERIGVFNYKALKMDPLKPRLAYFGDWDGDGRQDMLIHVLKSDHKYPIFYTSREEPFKVATFYENLGASEEDEWRPTNGYKIQKYGQSPFDLPPPAQDYTDISYFIVLDFNADGRSDLIWYRPRDGQHYMYINNSTPSDIKFIRQTSPAISNSLFTNNFQLIPRDFNNDGLMDLIFYSKNGEGYIKSEFYKTEPPSTPTISSLSLNVGTFKTWDWQNQKAAGWNIPIAKSDTSRVFFEDFNDDGLVDVLSLDERKPQSLAVGEPLKGGNVKIFPQKNYEVTKQGKLYFTHEFDFDSLGITPFELPIIRLYNEPGTPAIIRKNYEEIFLNDFNRDGLLDILIYSIEAGVPYFNFKINKGNFKFEKPDKNPINLLAGTELAAILAKTLSNKLSITDINRDNYPDLVFEASNLIIAFINEGNFQFVGPINYPKMFFDSNNSEQRANYLTTGPSYDFSYNYDTGENFYNFSSGGYELTIDKIAETTKQYSVTYSTLFNQDVFNINQSVAYDYPLTKSYVPITVVQELFMQSNLTFNTFRYSYTGSVVDLRGKGFRGFESILTKDSGKNLDELKSFKYSVNSRIDPLFSVATYSNGKVLTSTTIEQAYLADNISLTYFPFPKQSKTTRFEPSNQTMKDNTITRQRFDSFGNLTVLTTDYGEGMIDSVVNVYQNDKERWHLGRLVRATVYKLIPGKPLQTSSTLFEYDEESGLLIKEITNSGSGNEELQTEKKYSYDVYGNIHESSKLAWNNGERETRTLKSYMDSLGRFTIRITNALGHTSTSRFDDRNGNILETEDLNGLVTKYKYDKWGRRRMELFPDGNWKSTDYYFYDPRFFGTPYECKENCPDVFPKPYIGFVIHKQSSIAPPIIEYYDELGRNVGSRTTGFNGQNVSSYRRHSPINDSEINVEYNAFTDDETPQETILLYDEFGRHIKTIAPDSRISEFEYNGKITTYINALGQKKLFEKNVRDQITKVTDDEGNAVLYDYDANGNLLKSTDPLGNVIYNEYDSRGLKTSTSDPNVGTFRYEYNGFGELVKQTNPQGLVSEFKTDKLGRMIEQIEPEGKTVWTYDSGLGASIGKVIAISYSAGNIGVEYQYDSLGRLAREIQNIDGESYTSSTQYDSKGRPNTYTYPSGFQIRYGYNELGFLEYVQRLDDKIILWRAKNYNARDQLTLQEFGNGILTQYSFNSHTNLLEKIEVSKGSKFLSNHEYEYDKLGNLVSRTDVLRDLTEAFKYDRLNRLTSAINGVNDVTVSYDLLGNIVYKSDVGSYEYGKLNNGPHQVVRITPVSNVDPLICIPSLNLQTEYNSFDKVKKISNDTAYVEFAYGVAKQRVMQKMFIKGVLIKTKIYVNSNFEVEITLNEKRLVHYIRGANGVIGVYIKNNQGKSSTQYWHKDNLNSLIAVSDEQGSLVKEFSYDAWGKRRELNGAPASSVYTLGAGDERGFTSHEHYDLFDIVDMNGRIYDSTLGRFLSPDPFIQDISNLQNFNRYSYALNNPLTYIDPSGYFHIGGFSFPNPFNAIRDIARYVAAPLVGIAAFSDWAWEKGSKWLKENWKTVLIVAVVVAASALTGGALGVAFAAGGPYALWGAVISGAVGGFAGGFTGTLMSGGTLGDAFKSGGKGAALGAVSAGLTYGVGSTASAVTEAQVSSAGYSVKIMGHGLVQGGMAKVQGGKFAHGFYSGAVTGGFEPVNANISSELGRVATAAALGGTTSEINGGKFVNGAVTGAYVQLFNSEAHALQEKINRNSETASNAATVAGASASAFEEISPKYQMVFKRYGEMLNGLPGIVEGGYNLFVTENYTNAANAFARAGLSIGFGTLAAAGTTALLSVAAGTAAIPFVISAGAAVGVGFTVNIFVDSLVNQTLIPK